MLASVVMNAVSNSKSINLDGPKHHEIRRVTNPGYSVKALVGKCDKALSILKPEIDKYNLNDKIKLVKFCKSVVTEQLATLLTNHSLDGNQDKMLRVITTHLNVFIFIKKI